MVDRIRQLIQARRLSPTQFADTIGVARPIVSHILGGRNKPSLEVVQKIITAFPDVSMPWLLTGQGAMDAQDPNTAATVPEPSSQPLKPSSVAKRGVKPVAPAGGTRDEAEAGAATTGPLAAPSYQLTLQPEPAQAAVALAASPVSSPTPPQSATELTPPAPVTSPLMPAAQQSKTIRRVLIFYSDGTFTDYSPGSDFL